MKKLVDKAIRVFVHGWNSRTFSSWMRAGVGVVQIVIILPLVLREFSSSTATLFFLLTTIAALSPLLSAGFNPTFTRFFAYARSGLNLDQVARLELDHHKKPELDGATNYELVADTVIVGRMLFKLIGFGTLAILATGGSFIVAPAIERIDASAMGWCAWVVVVVSMSVSVYNGFYRSYLEGMGYMAKANHCGIFAGAISCLASLGTMLAGGGILGLILARQSSGFIDLFYLRHFSRKVEGRRWESFNRPLNPLMLKVSWRSAWRSAIGNFGFLGLNNMIAASSSFITGFANFGAFLFAYRLLDQIKLVSLAPFYSHLPDLQKSFVRDTREQIIKDCGDRISYSLYAYSGLCAVLLFLGDNILSLIGSNTGLPNSIVLVILCSTFFVQRYCGMITQVYTMSNDIIWHWSALIYGLPLVLLVFLLGGQFGTNGVVFAFFYARVFVSLPYLTFMLVRFLGVRSFVRLHRPILMPFLFLFVSIICYLISSYE